VRVAEKTAADLEIRAPLTQKGAGGYGSLVLLRVKHQRKERTGHFKKGEKKTIVNWASSQTLRKGAGSNTRNLQAIRPKRKTPSSPSSSKQKGEEKYAHPQLTFKKR